MKDRRTPPPPRNPLYEISVMMVVSFDFLMKCTKVIVSKPHW